MGSTADAFALAVVKLINSYDKRRSIGRKNIKLIADKELVFLSKESRTVFIAAAYGNDIVFTDIAAV